MSASNRALSNRVGEWGARGVNAARNLSRVSPFVRLAARPCPSALFLAHKPFSNPVSALRTRYFEKHLTRKKRQKHFFTRQNTLFSQEIFFIKDSTKFELTETGDRPIAKTDPTHIFKVFNILKSFFFILGCVKLGKRPKKMM